MKKLFSLLGLLLWIFGSAQTNTVNYTPTTAVFSNPERGFYRYTATHSGTYNSLNQNTLINYRLNNNITLIFRYFYMEEFLNAPISDAFLANVQSDFNKIRNAGLKCVIRFAYTSDENAPQKDASKAQILAHIQQLRPILQANADVISVMQAGFIGVWGEWYYTSQPEFGGWGYNQTDLTTGNNNHRKDILNAILTALPSNRMVQVRYPAFKQGSYSPTALSDSQAFSQTNLARIGHHNDCFLASATDYGTYENVSQQYPYLEQDTKFVPMGGETCKLNSPRTDCSTAMYEMAKFHWSFLNIDYFPGVIDGFTTNNCFTDIQKKLGYRFELNSATFPQSASIGTSFPVTLKITNQGYAAPYNQRTVYLILKNQTTNQIYSIPMATDPRKWLGPNQITIAENLTLPANIINGSYKLYLSIPDADTNLSTRPEYAIRLANENTWEASTGYNNLNYTLNVSDALAVDTHDKIDMAIYPVPANDLINVEFDGIENYQISLFNSLGQIIKIPQSVQNNKLSIDVSSINNGLYFIEFTKDGNRDTRKIIVKH